MLFRSLVAEGVRKSFREPSGGALEVLRGVSLSLKAGEAAAVVGASGAGKTTLLHVVGGLEAADEGSVRLTHSLEIGLPQGGTLLFVMPGLVPGIHVLPHIKRTWMAGTSPALTAGDGGPRVR